MFERDFTYIDLEQVETEIKNIYAALANIYKNKSYIWKISRTLDKLKNSNFSSTEKYIISIFESEYAKRMNRIDEAIDFLQKFIKQDDFKILSDTIRGLINEIKQYLLSLKQDNIYSANRTAFRTTIIRYIKSIKILKIQKEIVKKLIENIDVKDKKKLYIEFLKNESEIYRIYNNLPDKFIKDKKTYISHVSNSMLSDAKEIIAKGIKYKIFSILNFVVFGALLCIPYFLELKRVPEISIGSIPISLVEVFAIAVFLTLYLCILVFLQNYFLFRVWYESKNKIKYYFIGVDFVAILLMALFPRIYDILNLLSSSHGCLSDIGCLFGIILGLHAALLVFFFRKFWLDNKDEWGNIVPAALLIFISDLLILIAIYFNYADEYIIVVAYMAILSFLIRFLQIRRQFTYKVILVILSLMAFVFLLFASNSGFFVRVVGMANYRDDYTIKSEFIDKFIKEIPYCISNYDETCIDRQSSDTNKTKFNNLLFRIKSDDKYYFRAFIKDGDYNTTQKIDFSDDYKCGSNINKMTCYNVNDNNITTMRVKIQNTKDKSIQFDRASKKYFIDFEVRSGNILN